MSTYNIQDHENLRKKIRAERELRGDYKEEVILSYHEHLKNPLNETIVTEWPSDEITRTDSQSENKTRLYDDYHLAVGSTETLKNTKKLLENQLYDELEGYVDDKYLE